MLWRMIDKPSGTAENMSHVYAGGDCSRFFFVRRKANQKLNHFCFTDVYSVNISDNFEEKENPKTV